MRHRAVELQGDSNPLIRHGGSRTIPRGVARHSGVPPADTWQCCAWDIRGRGGHSSYGVTVMAQFIIHIGIWTAGSAGDPRLDRGRKRALIDQVDYATCCRRNNAGRGNDWRAGGRAHQTVCSLRNSCSSRKERYLFRTVVGVDGGIGAGHQNKRGSER